MYKLQQNSVKRLSDGASIPFADGNKDYEEYKQWLAKGGIPEPEFTAVELLAQAKETKRNQIRNAFNAQAELPVVVGTVSYHGGFDSASKLDAAKRMVEASGGLKVTFFDTTNLPHVLTLLEAATVILTIGADYQTKFATKQAKMAQVENATTILEVKNVSA